MLQPPGLQRVRYDFTGIDAERDRGQEEKRMTEDEMAGWHHRLDGLVFG